MAQGPPSDTDADANGQVAVGRYVLAVANPSGTTIEESTIDGGGATKLAHAIEATEKEESHRRSPVAVVETSVDDAAGVTGKIERAIGLTRELTSGRLDTGAIGDELDALVGLAQRLDRAGRFPELIRLARCLSKLLTLANRWLALLRTLRSALAAARQLRDADAEAWALHELGTLHLACGMNAKADDMLTRAHELRARRGDRNGLTVTEHNLRALCRTLRRQLHEQGRDRSSNRVVRTPALLALIGALLFVVGGTAGAMFDRARNAQTARRAVKTASSRFEKPSIKRRHKRVSVHHKEATQPASGKPTKATGGGATGSTGPTGTTNPQTTGPSGPTGSQTSGPSGASGTSPVVVLLRQSR